MVRVDARGMSCPQPVLMAKKTFEQNKDKFEIIVDNNVAKENVSRFANNAGLKVVIEEIDDDFLIKVSR